AALSGSLEDVPELLEQLAAQSASPEARAWQVALSAAAWALSPRSFEKPVHGSLLELVHAPVEVRQIAALSLTHLERASAIGFETAELERLLLLHERLLGSSSE